MNALNVFEHQRFLVRRPPDEEHPLGAQLRLSWQEIMTGKDEPLHFDYPIEYFNIAALGLCVALTQAALEPEHLDELQIRLQTRISDTDIEAAIAVLRDLFTIDGKIRFLQGLEPPRDKKGRLATGHLSELILSIKKGDKVFLNRPDPASVVALDQIPLLLFSRSTFFEKSAGRGYLTGTSGDLEIRTFLIDPTSLRRTVWLNVLSREQQTDLFTAQEGSTGYDKWMWHQPPDDDVAQGALSLRAGLLWMVANAYIEIEEIADPRLCIVTGEQTTGRVGTGVVVTATGRGYGVKVQREKGPEIRMSFFHHPNAPWQTITPAKGDPFIRHLSVAECSGLIGQMAGLFFASGRRSHKPAPVIEQLSALRRHGFVDEKTRLDLLCFGFHMLSSKQNVHGGYEVEQYHYPILGSNDEDPGDALSEAEGIMERAAERVEKIEWILKRAVQMCTLKEMDVEVQEDRTLQFKEKKKIDEGGMMRDAATELWTRAGEELRSLIAKVGATGRTAEDLQNASDQLQAWWTDRIVEHAETIFLRVFNDYSASSQHLAAAHNARRLFNGGLYKIDPGVFSRRKNMTQPEPAEEMES